MKNTLYILFLLLVWLIIQNQSIAANNPIEAIFIDGQLQNSTQDSILIDSPKSIVILLKEQDTNIYHYRLDGVDESQKVSNFPVAIYPKLKKGVYDFYIFDNKSDSDNSPHLTIHVSELIKNGFFQYWSFLPLLILYLSIIFGGAGYFIIISNFRNKRKISDLRNDWTNKLHNDIGGDLSSIAMRLRNISKQLNGASPILKKNILKIDKITDGVQKKLRFLFDLIDPKKNSLHVIVADLYAFANDNCKINDMKLNYENNLNPDQHYKIDIRRINKLHLIVKEAINNSSKHSQASELSIFITPKQKNIAVKIADNGIGFQYPPASTFSGNGINNLKQYSKTGIIDVDIQSKVGEGTTVSVSIPYI